MTEPRPLRPDVWPCDVCGRVATVTLAGMHRCGAHAPGGPDRWHPIHAAGGYE